MPSLPTHFFVGAALGQAAGARLRGDWRFWIAAMVCSALPDADVIGFSFGIPYGALWGHRGLSHSIAFALVVGIAAGISLGGGLAQRAGQSILLFVITCSHGVLDAMTNGGLGVAFFSPFDTTRYFLPWRPILVSPLGLNRFISARGLSILLNEFVFVWLPAVVAGFVLNAWRRRQATLNLAKDEAKEAAE
jgi:inner membrane protein